MPNIQNSENQNQDNEDLFLLNYNAKREIVREKITKNKRATKLIEIIQKKNVLDTNNIKNLLEISLLDRQIRAFLRNKKECSDEEFINNICEVLENLLNKNIPKRYNYSILSSMMLRNLIIPLQGYVLVSEDWIVPLAKWIGDRKCLEIMAGKGTLSYALKCQGKNVISTDIFNWSKFDFNNLWTEIEKIDAIEAIEKYGKDVDIIIMSWCYMDRTGYECLKKMREINKNLIMIYIGEPQGGCTGNDLLYEEMIEIESEEVESINEIFPNFFGIHDRIFIIR